MTVKELRQLLFDVENQDTEIAVVLKTKYGEIQETKTVGRIEPNDNFTLVWLS